jgi:hypothetical protein
LKRESAIGSERSAERIRADLERARAELARSVQALRLEVARTVDWREWIRRYPAVFLIGAFTAGFALGMRRRV